jgi:hypothetical protein
MIEENVFKTDAKQIVDMAFDAKLFNDSLTRDDFNSFEELIGFLLQSRYESYIRVSKLLDRIQSNVDKSCK